MTLKSKIILSTAISALILSACGGGSGGSSGTTTPTTPTTDNTAPTVTFNPTSLTVDSEATGESSLTATDNVSVTTGPTVSCTNGGSFSGSTFTAPTATAETTSVCTATASDAAGNEGSATLTVTITPLTVSPPPPPTGITFEGHVVKGAILGAPLGILDAVNPISAADSALVESVTADDGSYSLTIPEGTQVTDLLIVSSLLGSAQMICDAANCLSEGGINFGDPLLIPADSDPNFTKFLSAAIPTPEAFGTTEVNVNMFSHYQVLDMLGVSLARQGAGGTPTIFLQDYAAARQSTAAIFGLPDADFFAIPFVDITQPITSTDSNAIYAALVSGGLLGAALEAVDPFAAIFDLQNRTAQDNFIARESVDNPEMISLQDIFENATALATQIGATGNAFTSAQTALSDRQALIADAIPDLPLESDGGFPQPPAEISFAVDNISVNAGDANFLLVGIDNPDGLFPLNSSQSVPPGEISFFADVTSVVPAASISLNLFGSSPTGIDFSFGGDLTAGTYETEVTFTVSEFNQTYTDTITIEVTPIEIGIVQESVSMTTASNSTFRLDFVNPNNVDISTVTIDNLNGPSYFEVLSIDASGADVGYGPSIGSAPAGTYNVNVTLGQGLGAEANNVSVPLEIIVTQP